jgi:general secretion pathway protein G
MKKKRHFTLIEVMIVIVLIGLIGSVVAYNLRGSLEEGKIFKSQQGGAQVYNILALEVARGNTITEVQSKWQEIINDSPLAKKPKELIRDGWGELYNVEIEDNDLIVTSRRYSEIQQEKGEKDPKEWHLS